MANSMTPQARQVWGSKGGQDLMRKFLAGKPADESNQPTLNKLHQLNQNEAQSQQARQQPAQDKAPK
jgi:hypothetical protein